MIFGGMTRCGVLLAAVVAANIPARAQAPVLTALSMIQPGQWILKPRAARGAVHRLCLSDARILLQLQHSGAACSRFVIANDPRQTVVHYTCPGAGHGRTSVKVETGSLIQVESQGIANNDPFDWILEGRRVGDCADGKR